jgi:hypothetical protein
MKMPQLSQLFKIVKPQTPSEKKTRTVVDTIMVTPALLEKWKSPPFQRPVKQNEKVRALAEELKHDGGVWPGIITLAILDGVVYLIDGQHRKEAFMLSGLQEGYTDVRTHYVNTMADMGEEFVRLNSQLVRMRPDDILRGLESSIDGLRKLRAHCPFIGYDSIRRSQSSPVVGMSLVLRAWRGSMGDVPGVTGNGMSAAAIAESLEMKEYEDLIEFLNLALGGFGRDAQYGRLWSGLNLIICMWLYRRLVLHPDLSSKVQPVSRELFKKCLMSISATSDYVDWLHGRMVGERDRAPAYARLKAIFAARLQSETNKKIYLPQPPWAH